MSIRSSGCAQNGRAHVRMCMMVMWIESKLLLAVMYLVGPPGGSWNR